MLSVSLNYAAGGFWRQVCPFDFGRSPKLCAFAPEEVARAKTLNDGHRSRVILLTARELEPYLIFARTKKEDAAGQGQALRFGVGRRGNDDSDSERWRAS